MNEKVTTQEQHEKEPYCGECTYIEVLHCGKCTHMKDEDVFGSAYCELLDIFVHCSDVCDKFKSRNNQNTQDK